MPLYSFILLDDEGKPTGEEIEELYKWNTVPKELVSSSGRRAVRKGIELIAKPALALGGLHGHYDPHLGAVYSSYAERDAICKARGLTPTDCIDKHWADDKIESDIRNQLADSKKSEMWEAACEKFDFSISSQNQEDEREYAEKAERVWEELIPFEALKNGHTTDYMQAGSKPIATE